MSVPQSRGRLARAAECPGSLTCSVSTRTAPPAVPAPARCVTRARPAPRPRPLLRSRSWACWPSRAQGCCPPGTETRLPVRVAAVRRDSRPEPAEGGVAELTRVGLRRSLIVHGTRTSAVSLWLFICTYMLVRSGIECWTQLDLASGY